MLTQLTDLKKCVKDAQSIPVISRKASLSMYRLFTNRMQSVNSYIQSKSMFYDRHRIFVTHFVYNNFMKYTSEHQKCLWFIKLCNCGICSASSLVEDETSHPLWAESTLDFHAQ